MGVTNPSGGGGGGGGLTNINVSAGTTSNNLSNLVFSNSNGVSFGLNASTITASVAAGGGLTNINVSAGTTSQNLSNIVFSNSNNLSLGLNGSTITGTVTVASTQGSINLSAGTTSNLASAFTFSNSNNVSFGLNASTLTATVTVASTQGSINLSAGTTSNLASAFTFSNSNNVSFGLNASTVTATVTVASTQGSINLSAGTTSNLASAFTFSNSNGISFGLNASTITGSVATSLTNIRVSAGTTSNLLSAITFSNSNGISFGIDASTVTASHNGITNQSNQTLGLYAVGNTTGQSSSSTFDARTVSFVGQGIASVGFSNGSVNISVPSGGGGLTNIRISAGTTNNLLSDVTFSNSNGVSFGINASTITASVAAGGAAPTLSIYSDNNGGATTTTQPTINSMWVWPLHGGNVFPGNMTPSQILIPFTGTVTATASSSSCTHSLSLAFYTWNNSTLSRIFSAVSTFSTAAATANSSLSNGIKWWTFHSSLFDVQPTFSQTNYWAGLIYNGSNFTIRLSLIANRVGHVQNSLAGTFGVNSSTNTNFGYFPFWGHLTANASSGPPVSVSSGQYSYFSGVGAQMPKLVMNNLQSTF